ncbi:hypothetical protein FOZ60_013935 [Perkinsus olseni]|uniref:DUF7164 domain-containing protein n=1 Tax=Perkinsus olseni TaxID=32597 RepID=A0A7J6P7R1_PEROL|nr:hypothetical protein FOZ60_013935 [Perkinsus olseni]
MPNLFAVFGAVSFLCFLFQGSFWAVFQPCERRFRGTPMVAARLNSSAYPYRTKLTSNTTRNLPVVLTSDRGGASTTKSPPTSSLLGLSRVTGAAASLDAVVGDLGEPLDFRANTTTRAVMAFLPATPPLRFPLSEFARLRTDFVIFTTGKGKEFARRLGCTNEPRTFAKEPSRCIIVDYVPLEDRLAPHGEPDDPLRDYTAYVDCMLTIAEYQGYEYDYVLRTDLDAFLMPGFADWTPKSRNQLVVGWGGYSSKNAELHLKYVTETLGLRDKGLTSLGSTWYGNLRLFKASANLTLAVIRWLLTQEFSEFEKCCSGVKSWPHWHRAVALLYGGHVALNHIGDNVLISGAENGFMDFQSVKTEPITNKQIKHVHCWHTRELFSKFEFHEGAYDQLDLTPYLDMSTTRDYVVTLAVSSVRLSDSELAKLSRSTDLLRNRSSWLRLPLRDASNGVKIYVE